jgi:hypothetical protein
LVEWDASWNASTLKQGVWNYLQGLPRGAVPTWVLGARNATTHCLAQLS